MTELICDRLRKDEDDRLRMKGTTMAVDLVSKKNTTSLIIHHVRRLNPPSSDAATFLCHHIWRPSFPDHDEFASPLTYVYMCATSMCVKYVKFQTVSSIHNIWFSKQFL